MSVIQLPKISKELEEEYLADVQKSYKELLEKLKKSRNDVKKKKTKPKMISRNERKSI